MAHILWCNSAVHLIYTVIYAKICTEGPGPRLRVIFYLIESDNVRMIQQLHHLYFLENLLQILVVKLCLLYNLYCNLCITTPSLNAEKNLYPYTNNTV